MKKTATISIEDFIHQKGKEKAAKIGMTFSAYIAMLISKDK